MNRVLRRIERAVKTMPSRRLRWSRALRRRLSTPAPTLFVNAFPKSGSTWLVFVLEQTSGFRRLFLGADFRAEQNLYLPRLLDGWSLPSVAHHHTLANPPNLELMRDFGIHPVLLLRDLGDCLVSLRDHLLSESPVTPTFIAPRGFESWSADRQLDALIDLAAPWYLAFVNGWQQAQADGMPVLWLHYRDLVARPRDTVEQVLDWYALGYERANVDAAIALARVSGDRTRRNSARSGRGRELLDDARRARLDAMLRHYPDARFGCVGAPFAGERRGADAGSGGA